MKRLMVLDPITGATRTRIGELLLATGAITQQQLVKAARKGAGKRRR